MKKTILAIVAICLVVVVGAVIFLKSYVTPERIKTFLVPYAEDILQRKVRLGEIQIGLMTGIDVKDFAIRERDDAEDFLRCKDFVLKFRLLPLLSGKVIIDELTLRSPSVRAVRDANGRFNFDDIGRKEEAPAEQVVQRKEGEAGPAISLLINKISVQDMRFSLSDATKALPDLKGSLAVNARVAGGENSSLSSEGKAVLHLDEILLTAKPVRDVSAELNYSAGLDTKAGHVSISKAELLLQGIRISGTGEIKNYRKEAEANISIAIPDMDLATLQKELSQFAVLQGVALTGALSSDITVSGMVKQPDIRFTLSSKQITVAGSATAAAPEQNVTGAKGAPAAGKASKEAEALDLKMSLAGEIRVDSILYKGLSMNELLIRLQLKNNRFEVQSLTASAGKGKLSMNSIVDLSRPGYIYSLGAAVNSVDANEIVGAFFPKAKDTVFGLVSADIRASGAGTLPDTVKKNLISDANFDVRDGKITNTKVADNLAAFLGVDELKTIHLRQAKGTVKIRDRIARLDSLFASDDISMDPGGDIGLDESLNLAIDLKLSPRLTDKAMSSGVAQYIKNEEGWGTIPLNISGTLSNPSYKVDVAKAGKRVIQKEIGKSLQKLFNKDDGSNGSKAPQEKRPVQDLFKGLFR